MEQGYKQTPWLHKLIWKRGHLNRIYCHDMSISLTVWGGSGNVQVQAIYLDRDHIHSRVETAVLSHGILILRDHHYINHACQVIMVPYCCRVYTPTHTHTQLFHNFNNKMYVDSLTVKSLNYMQVATQYYVSTLWIQT